TFDGLSIAWAVAEHLATHPKMRPKTLFATHYHELTDLADATPGVVNFHVAAREWKDEIIFLRKIVPGRSDRSYGIQVARLAGLPKAVIDRAREILGAPEPDELARGGRPSVSGTALAAIGVRSRVGLAYSLKFLGAPLIDRVDAPAFGRLGRRRGWMVVSQLLVAAGLVSISMTGLKAGLPTLGALALVVAFSSS